MKTAPKITIEHLVGSYSYDSEEKRERGFFLFIPLDLLLPLVYMIRDCISVFTATVILGLLDQ